MDLTDQQFKELRADLERVRKEIEAGMEDAADSSKPVSLDDPIGRLSRMDAIQQQQMAEDQKSRRQLRLQQVEAALSKMASDRYGECVRCEEPISFKRLKVRPESPFCANCQGRTESKKKR